MRERVSTGLELVGFAAVSVGVGKLAGLWWGVVVAGVASVVVGFAVGGDPE